MMQDSWLLVDLIATMPQSMRDDMKRRAAARLSERQKLRLSELTDRARVEYGSRLVVE